MKLASIGGRIRQGFSGERIQDLQGILSESAFRGILSYERALSDRHERQFSLLIFSPSADRHAQRFNTTLIDLLKARLRMTDVAGWVERGRVGVILPYSDHAGARVVADVVCAGLVSQMLPGQYDIHTYPGEDAGGVVSTQAFSSSPAMAGEDQSSGAHRLRTMSLLAPALPRYKRVLDVAISLFGLILVSPLLVIIAGVIKLVSPGPVFFKQERVGYLTSPFLCWKFRTMTVAADAGVHRQHLSGLMLADVPMTKLDGGADSRVIPCGQLLRASGLDELPQLINVLRGEMSFVGPRPCMQYEYKGYQRWHKRRFDSLPGLTGLWQVSGKNRTTFSQMMRLDVAYARAQTMPRDLAIVWRTLPVLIEQVQGVLAQRRAKPAPQATRAIGIPA
ncbi:MAG: sugar transferase [Lentisphaerae bacterium]|nr:sugar transferase [Lentisphaerota bacterium]